MSQNSNNVTLMIFIIINKLFDNKYCFKYKNLFQIKWCRLKLFIMTFLLCMRNVCFNAKNKFFFKILLWLIDEKLYTSWIFIEYKTFIECDYVFIEFCAFSLFCRYNCNVIMFTSLKFYVLCQLLLSMRLLI